MVFRQCFRLGDGNIFFAHVSLVLFSTHRRTLLSQQIIDVYLLLEVLDICASQVLLSGAYAIQV